MNGVTLQPLAPERLEAAGQWWALLQEPDVSPEDVSAWLEWIEAEPENRDAYQRIQELTQRLRATGKQQSKTRRRISQMKWQAAALVLLSVAGLAMWRMHPESPAATMAFSTPVAGIGQAPLPDGSKVSLGGATSIEAVYSDASRDIRLKEGEAFFEVQHEQGDRAFIVQSGSISIRAVGTAFNVRKTGERVTVTVTEGKVQVARSDGSVLLLDGVVSEDRRAMIVAGQQATYDPASNRLSVVTRGQDAQRALAWREQQLEFADDPLDTVVANINRYSPRHIEVRDVDLHRHTYTGTFQPSRLDEWLIAIERSFPVEIRTTSDGVVIESRK
ncbi:FecR family protein [Steroidobacter sp.]|uniref:FecR family protein n=1 Tax=Steroidobacter sp. TaxID=1978227 RepID=UPI001A3CBF72|nr:FecR domain-containing protein [Steroidobacter sp.]MBL8271908.1 FecR domain-containing protein [Steroidobacter sp.]